MKEFHFQSAESFCAFLVFVALFIIIVLLDMFFNSNSSHDNAERPIYGRHQSLRFHVKKLMARLLLRLGKRDAISDAKVDKVQVFSPADDKVRSEHFFETQISIKKVKR